MSEKEHENFQRSLKVGWAVSLEGVETGQLAAAIRDVTGTQLGLQIVRPLTEPEFQKGDRVRIKYWDDTAAVYCWNAEVLEAATEKDGNSLTVRVTDSGVTIQRRSHFRLRSSVPFAFTVIDASSSNLLGKRVKNCTTRDISVGGLRFETGEALQSGDKLEINLYLPPPESSSLQAEGSSRDVHAVGWVVRTTPAETPGALSVAVQFIQLYEEEQLDLLEFLAEQSRNLIK